MSNSSPPVPPSSSDQCIPIGPKSKQEPSDISAQDLVPVQQRKTRDLPNLSDCHGCGRRINYSNPWERLQPLDSVWRLVLLCKKCRKQVNSGQLCPYCFKDTSKSVSDCFSCSNCHHLVHTNCINKYENSAPGGYSNGVGVEVTVCIDCWVPDLLRRSIRVRGKKSDEKGLTVRSVCKNAHCESLGKGNSAGKSLKEVAKEAECVLQKNVSFAVKAKKTSLRKAIAAKNIVESANDALDLIVKSNDKCKEKVELTGQSHNGSRRSDSIRVVDDAELAMQLCHAMNGSARIPKNTKFCSSDLLNTSEPFGVLTESMDLKHNTKDGEIAGCSNTQENRMHSGKNSAEPNGVEAIGSCTFTCSSGLKPELFTYKRKNRKRKRLHQSYIETSRNHASNNSFELKPELLTYKRNRRNRKKDSQQSNTDTIGITTCSDSSVLKPELVTYKRKNRKGKECLQSIVEANGSCSTIDSIGRTSELFTYKRKNRKSKDFIDNVSKLVTESQPSLQDDKKEGVFCNDGRSSSPEGCITDFGAEDWNSNSISDICLTIDNARSSGSDDLTHNRNDNSYSGSFAFKYSRRTAASRSTLHDDNGKSNSCVGLSQSDA